MMTSKSKRFRILEQELKKLRKYFLPRQFDPQGNYSERQIALATAYRVLAHAEIEAYLEDRVLEIHNYAMRIWKQNKRVTKTLTCLFAFLNSKSDIFSDLSNLDQGSSEQIPQKKLKFDEKRKKVSEFFHTSVQKNHGVRIKNILSLLLPIGIDIEELDEIWLQEMNNFGKKRGDFAHQSASNYKTNQLPDPKSELEMINRLVYGSSSGKTTSEQIQGLIYMDQLLNNLLKS
jgi:hypothetical protein